MAPIRVCCCRRLPLLLTYWSNTWHIFLNYESVMKQQFMGREHLQSNDVSAAVGGLNIRIFFEQLHSLWGKDVRWHWTLMNVHRAALILTTGGTNKQMLIKGAPKQTDPHLTSLLDMRKICILKATYYIIDDHAVKYIHLHREDFSFPGLIRPALAFDFLWREPFPQRKSQSHFRYFHPPPFFFFNPGWGRKKRKKKVLTDWRKEG